MLHFVHVSALSPVLHLPPVQCSNPITSVWSLECTVPPWLWLSRYLCLNHPSLLFYPWGHYYSSFVPSSMKPFLTPRATIHDFLLCQSLSILQVPVKSIHFMVPSLTLKVSSLLGTWELLCVYFFDGTFLLPYMVITCVFVLPHPPIKLEIPYIQKLALWLIRAIT